MLRPSNCQNTGALQGFLQTERARCSRSAPASPGSRELFLYLLNFLYVLYLYFFGLDSGGTIPLAR
jgi:hypothetical protein